MKRRFLIAVSAAAGTLALLPGLGSAGPPPTLIEVDDSVFRSANESQIIESATTWRWADTVFNPHNVREDSKLFYSGDPTSTQGTEHTERVSAGTFHYYCEEHGSRSGGMDGVVTVTPLMHGAPTNDTIPVQWAEATSSTGDQYDLKWKGPGSGGEYRTWVKNVDFTSALFGFKDEPVDVQPGRTYKIKARSELASNTERRSGFSPPLVATADE